MSVIFILGGDGYCGWPLSLKLASEGYSVVIVDNLIRRKIDNDLNIKSLTPISSIEERVVAAKEHNFDIIFEKLNIARDNKGLRYLLEKYQPCSIVNMAHQRSVPYSSIDYDKSAWTIENTILGQMSLLESVKDICPEVQVIHLGSLGIFGYRDIGGPTPIKNVKASYFLENGQEFFTKSQVPFAPDSIYHLSKSLNAQLNEFYSRVHGCNILDIYQGTVWGCEIDNFDDNRLINRYDYDEVYGTVINRFCYQASKKQPLTVYGSGKQHRGFIHIKDSVEIIYNLIVKKTQKKESVKIITSVTDVFNIKTLAEHIASLCDSPKVIYIKNSRTEAEENFYIQDRDINKYTNIEGKIISLVSILRKL